MAIDKVITPLLRVPLFLGLRTEQLAEIARHAERVSFRAGSKITEAGVTGDGAYLIVAGDAARVLPDGSLEAVEAGSLIGELAMLVDHVYGTTVVAEGRVNCLKLLRNSLYEQMERDPELAEHLSEILTERLKNVAEQMRHIDQLLAASEAAPADHGHARPLGPAADALEAAPMP